MLGIALLTFPVLANKLIKRTGKRRSRGSAQCDAALGLNKNNTALGGCRVDVVDRRVRLAGKGYELCVRRQIKGGKHGRGAEQNRMRVPSAYQGLVIAPAASALPPDEFCFFFTIKEARRSRRR